METEIQDEKEWDSELKSKERIFVLNYCCNEDCFMKARESYRATYQKPNEPLLDDESCSVGASRLLKKERVKNAISRLMQKLQPELDEKNGYKILHDLMNIAMLNPAEIIDGNGNLIVDDLKHLGDKAKFIAQIKPGITTVRDGQVIDGKPQIILKDPTKYVDMALKYLALIREQKQIDVTIPVIEVTPKIEGENAVDKWNEIAQKENK